MKNQAVRLSPSGTIYKDDPPPCDGCSNRSQCQEYHLACDLFFRFSESGKVPDVGARDPNSDYYDAAYAEGEARQDLLVVDSQTLYDLNCKTPRKRRDEWIRRQVEETYTASTGHSFLDLILPEFDQFEMFWCITDKTHLVMGGVAVQGYTKADSVIYLYVRKAYQGMGVGSALMDKVEARSNYIILSPQEGSEGFYQKRGYKKRESIALLPIYEQRFE